MRERPGAVVFDIGRVLFDWNLRHLFEKLIDEPAQLDWFLSHVVTEEWHFQCDGGRPLAEMVPELQARFLDHAHLIDAYAGRFNETIDRPIEGTHALVRRLHAAGVPLFALTNFGAEFFADFRPTQPIFGWFDDIVVSGRSASPSPTRASTKSPNVGSVSRPRRCSSPTTIPPTWPRRANAAGRRTCLPTRRRWKLS